MFYDLTLQFHITGSILPWILVKINPSANSPCLIAKKEGNNRWPVREDQLLRFAKMVWISCIVIPLFLWIYAKFIQPLVNRLWKPAVNAPDADKAIGSEKTNEFPIDEVNTEVLRFGFYPNILEKETSKRACW